MLVVMITTVGSLAYAEVRREYYDNGKVQFEWNLKDGKLNGISKEYYESGQLRFEINYKDLREC